MSTLIKQPDGTFKKAAGLYKATSGESSPDTFVIDFKNKLGENGNYDYAYALIYGRLVHLMIYARNADETKTLAQLGLPAADTKYNNVNYDDKAIPIQVASGSGDCILILMGDTADTHNLGILTTSTVATFSGMYIADKDSLDEIIKNLGTETPKPDNPDKDIAPTDSTDNSLILNDRPYSDNEDNSVYVDEAEYVPDDSLGSKRVYIMPDATYNGENTYITYNGKKVSYGNYIVIPDDISQYDDICLTIRKTSAYVSVSKYQYSTSSSFDDSTDVTVSSISDIVLDTSTLTSKFVDNKLYIRPVVTVASTKRTALYRVSAAKANRIDYPNDATFLSTDEALLTYSCSNVTDMQTNDSKYSTAYIDDTLTITAKDSDNATFIGWMAQINGGRTWSSTGNHLGTRYKFLTTERTITRHICDTAVYNVYIALYKTNNISDRYASITVKSYPDSVYQASIGTSGYYSFILPHDPFVKPKNALEGKIYNTDLIGKIRVNEGYKIKSVKIVCDYMLLYFKCPATVKIIDVDLNTIDIENVTSGSLKGKTIYTIDIANYVNDLIDYMSYGIIIELEEAN